jgi:large subunit ribosomal protein L25
VDGATRQRVEDDPALEAYLRANFPEAFVEEEGDDEDAEGADPEEELDAPGDFVRPAKAIKERKAEEQDAFPLNIRPLVTYLRDPTREEGSRICRRLRGRDGTIPGLVYGSDPSLGVYSFQPGSKLFVKTPSSALQKELDRYGHHFSSRVYDLAVLDPAGGGGGEAAVVSRHRVVPRDVQRHPVHASVLYCANFCRYHPGRPLLLPVAYVNEEESPALKRDGFILPLKRYIECFVEDGAPIPERLDLECSGLRFKDVIRKDRVALPDGVRFSDRVERRGREFLIGVVFGRSRGAAAGPGGDDEAAAAGAAASA